MLRIQPQWVVGHAHNREAPPERFVPATVPGAVQLDWAQAQGWDPRWWYGEEFRRYRWMEDAFWTYRTVLPHFEGELWFRAKGADYRTEVRLNGHVLWEQDGTHLPISLHLACAKPGDDLEVVVSKGPEFQRTFGEGERLAATAKPAVFNGWDFAPRLVPLGLWDEAWLEVRDRAPWRADLSYALGDGFADIQLDAPDAAHWTLIDPDGQVVLEGTSAVSARLDHPVLWQPNGRGRAALYTSRVQMGDEIQEQRIGFRSVRLVMNEGAWAKPSEMPKSRSTPPITLEVNGVPMFGQGANWVPASMFPGTLLRADYSALLEQAHAAHFNLIRVWGGGGVPHDDFFDLCDELGILVWQEFPLACAKYLPEPRYMEALEADSRAVVRRLRHRASLAFWCGGNELFNSWSGMTDQDLALRLLNKVCFEEDPARPFLATSPLMGMKHGSYTFLEQDGIEAVARFQGAGATAYTEFGSSGPASSETIRSLMPESELWPPQRGTNWEWHNGLGAWDGHPESWLCPATIAKYFDVTWPPGPEEELARLIEFGQVLQTEGMRHLYEEARRQWPEASMALAWCFNEPWPTVANNSLVSWPAEAKPALHAVTEALAPVTISARVAKFAWRAGEVLEAELWAHNSTLEPVEIGTVWAELFVGDRSVEVAAWVPANLEPNRNQAGPVVRFAIPLGAQGEVRLALRAGGISKVYRFADIRGGGPNPTS